MICLRRARRVAGLILLGLAAGGCFPSATTQLDEEKEPHVQRAKALATALDIKSAVDMYEEALKVNPNNAYAHYELAILLQNHELVADPAAAIYHWERYLRLRPKATNGDVVKNHINACKLEIAKTIATLPLTPVVQRDYERTLAENRELKSRLAQWMAYAAHPNTPPPPATAVAPTNLPPPAPVTPPNPGRPAPTRSEVARPAPAPPAPLGPLVTTGNSGGRPTAATNQPVARAAATRNYVIKAGDRPAAIATQHGITLDALLAANPNLSPRHLQIGQTIIIPPR